MKSVAKTQPRRTCVGCGKRDEQRVLMRFAVSEGVLECRSPKSARGRSAYIHSSGACIERLEKSRWVDRSLRVRTDKHMRAHFASRLTPDGTDQATQTDR